MLADGVDRLIKNFYDENNHTLVFLLKAKKNIN